MKAISNPKAVIDRTPRPLTRSECGGDATPAQLAALAAAFAKAERPGR